MRISILILFLALGILTRTTKYTNLSISMPQRTLASVQVTYDEIYKEMERTGFISYDLINLLNKLTNQESFVAFLAVIRNIDFRHYDLAKLTKNIDNEFALKAFLLSLHNKDFRSYDLSKVASRIDNEFGFEVFSETIQNKGFRSYDLAKLALEIDNEYSKAAFLEVITNENFRHYDIAKLTLRIKSPEILERFRTSINSGFRSYDILSSIVKSGDAGKKKKGCLSGILKIFG